MGALKTKLLYGSALPLLIGVGVAITADAITVRPGLAAPYAANPRAAKNPFVAANPCNPCSPCGAKSPCGAANPCNPCSPCGAKSPCGAANPCNPCSPCGATNPCNPCSPCGAKSPCGAANPCGATGAAAGTDCEVQRLAQAATNPCNPCSPCAAKSPCGAANPCNPCSPCGAANPCNPCAPQANAELTTAEAAKVYGCLTKYLRSGYGKSGHPVAGAHFGWARYNTVPYVSPTHGGRYVNNYANAAAKAYARFENSGAMPKGSVLAKNSFIVNGKGQAVPGPLFVMEKMAAGFDSAGGDWRFTMIMPDGSVFGTTGGAGAGKVKFCAECHAAVGETQDHLFFLPEEYRVHI